MATKRTPRRRVRIPRTKATKKSGGTQDTQTVAALRKRIAKLEMTPFSNVGGSVGRSIGGLFGRPEMGRGLGSWLGSGIGKIFGSGAYNFKQNSSWNVAQQVPAMHSNNENVIIRHRDFITNVNSSVGFVNTEYQINPGLASTFPWLSSIASQFQEYDFRGLVFEFKSTSADSLSSTNTALGTIAMAVQYRADATAFTSKQQVLNEMWSADSKPSESFFMPVECAPAECPMDVQYIRTSALSSSDDIKFYDLGKLALSSVGSQAAAVVGELWVTYEVALKKPVLSGSIGIDALSTSLSRSSPTAGTAPNGTAFISSVNNFLGVTFGGTNSRTVTIPLGVAGKFWCSYFWYGGSASWVVPGFSFTNVTLLTTNGNATQQVSGGATIASASSSFIISVDDPSVVTTITTDTTGTFGATPVFELAIVQLDFDTVAT